MSHKYINIYNNLIKLTRNKKLFKNIENNDLFSDRLFLFLIHFGFFLKYYKKHTSKKEIQNIYDYIFKEIEISIREIGYGDMSINKRMKEYINLFHLIISKIDIWEKIEKHEKTHFLNNYLNLGSELDYLIKYFDKYILFLSNNALNFSSKDVRSFNF
tara:strand:+ start:29 stop:502 length:474 start_codon:yes stop_codon:yes gene_type:complete